MEPWNLEDGFSQCKKRDDFLGSILLSTYFFCVFCCDVFYCILDGFVGAFAGWKHRRSLRQGVADSVMGNGATRTERTQTTDEIVSQMKYTRCDLKYHAQHAVKHTFSTFWRVSYNLFFWGGVQSFFGALPCSNASWTGRPSVARRRNRWKHGPCGDGPEEEVGNDSYWTFSSPIPVELPFFFSVDYICSVD